MAQVGIRELLEAGVHFGHQTRRWNPKMRRFIFGERGGIHIIDLQQTEQLLAQAQEFAANVAGRGGTILFVGTKKQARDAVKDAAEKSGMPYVNQRWLGGLLTNFQTISKRIKRLADLDAWVEDGTMELLPTRERISALAEREKLTMNLGGVRNLQRPPDAMFVVDLKTEVIAVNEAARLKIPIIGLVDTNCDPDPGHVRRARQRRRDPVLQARRGRDRRRRGRARVGLPRRGGGGPPRGRGEGPARGGGDRSAQGGRGAGAPGGRGGERRRWRRRARPSSPPSGRRRSRGHAPTQPPRRARAAAEEPEPGGGEASEHHHGG